MGAGFFSGRSATTAASPADFVIDGEGIIKHAHHGDSLGVDEVVSLAREPGLAPAGATHR